MDKYSSLSDLIEVLEQGNRYHISVVFVSKNLRERMALPHRHFIHAAAVCDAAKSRPNGLRRCICCRRLALEKARSTGKPFDGLCINGVYEYCHPVFRRDSLCCIIFIGNILKDRDRFLAKNGLLPNDPLLQTMQQDMSREDCRKIAAVLESYIHMLLQLQPATTQDRSGGSIVEAVKGYADSYFRQDITLTEVAGLYHYNEKYLGMLFKKETGVCFHTYLNGKRLAFAEQLLRETEDSVSAISAKAGFNNVTYFNRLFKICNSLSPTDYRKKYTKIL